MADDGTEIRGFSILPDKIGRKVAGGSVARINMRITSIFSLLAGNYFATMTLRFYRSMPHFSVIDNKKTYVAKRAA